ncbi:MotE family protein, partial [Brevirhabdus pacifica]
GAAQAQTVPPKPGAPSGVPVPASLPDSCPVPEELLSAIRTERELLADQKDALSQRRAEIDLAEEKLRIETARLTELKTALEALMNKVETAEGEDVNRLVKLYTNMKPADAAQIMNEIDISVAVTVLGQMPERDAGPIMARLSMARARAVSKIILERSKLPGDQDLNGIVLQ